VFNSQSNTGYFTKCAIEHLKQFIFNITHYIPVPYNSHNKHTFFQTALASWSSYSRRCVFDCSFKLCLNQCSVLFQGKFLFNIPVELCAVHAALQIPTFIFSPNSPTSQKISLVPFSQQPNYTHRYKAILKCHGLTGWIGYKIQPTAIMLLA
jgi:hypothetical protein